MIGVDGAHEGLDISRPCAPFSVVLYECAMANRVASVGVVDYALVCLGVEGPGQLLEDRHEGVKKGCSN